MKKANGYGGIEKLSGRRRSPYRVRVTTGWHVDDVTGKPYQIRKTVGYYPNRNEAEIALAEYNKAPWDIDARQITFAEVYQKWADETYPKLSRSTRQGYEAAYRVCTPLADMRMIDINLDAMQTVLRESGKNYPVQKLYKMLLGRIYDFAIKHDYIPPERDKTQYIELDKDKNPNKLEREPFSAEEIATLWENQNVPYVNVVLMLIYSGLRVDELLEMQKKNVHLEERYVDVVKSKTDAGIRKVPVADRTFDFWEEWFYQVDTNEFLICTRSGDKMLYSNFLRKYWNPLMQEFGVTHRPHDTRHTAVSLLTAAGVDERVIEKIVGHKGNSVTRNVYTHLDIETMREAINKI